jgi:hypothetical protein
MSKREYRRFTAEQKLEIVRGGSARRDGSEHHFPITWANESERKRHIIELLISKKRTGTTETCHQDLPEGPFGPSPRKVISTRIFA